MTSVFTTYLFHFFHSSYLRIVPSFGIIIKDSRFLFKTIALSSKNNVLDNINKSKYYIILVKKIW